MEGHGVSPGQQALGETPFAEAARSLRFKKVRLEKPLEDELAEIFEGETELVGPGDIEESRGTQLINQYDREILFNQLPEGDFPLY